MDKQSPHDQECKAAYEAFNAAVTRVIKSPRPDAKQLTTITTLAKPIYEFCTPPVYEAMAALHELVVGYLSKPVERDGDVKEAIMEAQAKFGNQYRKELGL